MRSLQVAKFKNENQNSHEILKYSQIETIEIQNDARDENVTIYTTSQVQGTSASKKDSCSRLLKKIECFKYTVVTPQLYSFTVSILAGHEITYIDEQDGSHIGQSQRAQTVSVQSNPPPAKRRHLAPSNETQQAVIQNNSGRVFISVSNLIIEILSLIIVICLVY